MINEMIDIIKGILHEIIPKKCSFCLEDSDLYLCNKCYMKYLNNIKINKEYIKYKSIVIPYIFFGSYSILKEYIYRSKYTGDMSYIKSIVQYLVDLDFKSEDNNILIDILDTKYVIYVPSNFKKILQRGGCIPKYIFKQLKQSIERNYGFWDICVLNIFKENIGIDLKNMNKKERKKQIYKKFRRNYDVIQSEYELFGDEIYNRKILIIDDVVSSKTTIMYIVKELYNLGFRNICILSLANNNINKL